jgi:hypothetical protein
VVVASKLIGAHRDDDGIGICFGCVSERMQSEGERVERVERQQRILHFGLASMRCGGADMAHDIHTMALFWRGRP